MKTLIPTADHESKTFMVRVFVDNTDEKILIGMSARIKVKTQMHKNVVVVSQSSIVEERNGKSVYVAKENKAVKRPVVTGAIEGDRVAIVDGLSIGEDLIVMGHRELANDQHIKVVQ